MHQTALKCALVHAYVIAIKMSKVINIAVMFRTASVLVTLSINLIQPQAEVKGSENDVILLKMHPESILKQEVNLKRFKVLQQGGNFGVDWAPDYTHFIFGRENTEA